MIAALLLMAATPATGLAPSEEGAVLGTVQAWLDAFEAKDGAKLTELTHPDGVYYVVNEMPGRPPIRVGTNREDLVELVKPGPRFTERFWNPTVLIRGAMAQVWTPYSFDIDGKRSHCGINNFSLNKINGKWMMTNAGWTVEPPETSCAALGELTPDK